MLIQVIKTKTLLMQKVQRYSSKRTMFGSALKTSNRLCASSLQNVAQQERTFAAMAAKSKIPKSIQNQYPKEELKNNIHQHAQLVTDFNIVYDNPKDIKLYQIGTLHTNPTEASHMLSNEKNYKFEESTQQIKFFKTPVLVTKDLHIIKNSKKYFDDANIRANIEKAAEYKVLYNNVMQELMNKAIKFKVAQTPEDYEQTGFNVLSKLTPTQEKNSLLETLLIKNDKSQE